MVSVCEEATLALISERLLFGGNAAADPGRMPAKVLLVRSAAEPLRTVKRVQLTAASGEQDWREYEAQRLVLEAEFGVTETKARKMVDALRDRRARLGLELYLARDGERLVGAIGRFRLPAHPFWVRLQEVDVFPPWRGQGYGDGLLAAVLDLLPGERQQHGCGRSRRGRLAAQLVPQARFPRRRPRTAHPVELRRKTIRCGTVYRWAFPCGARSPREPDSAGGHR